MLHKIYFHNRMSRRFNYIKIPTNNPSGCEDTVLFKEGSQPFKKLFSLEIIKIIFSHKNKVIIRQKNMYKLKFIYPRLKFMDMNENMESMKFTINVVILHAVNLLK